MLTEAVSLGVDRLFNEVEDINYAIRRKFHAADVGELRGKPFFMVVARIIAVWMQVKSITAFTHHLLPTSLLQGIDMNKIAAKDFECMPKLISEMGVFE